MKIPILKAGELFFYSGELLIMRDSAQKRLKEAFEKELPLPISLSHTIVFYAGPAKTSEGYVLGAIGPTTSARMDKYLEFLFQQGVCATIGKGKRSEPVSKLCRQYQCTSFVTASGAATALLMKIKKARCIAYEDLGTEAIYWIEVADFPLLTAIDTQGNDIFRE